MNTVKVEEGTEEAITVEDIDFLCLYSSETSSAHEALERCNREILQSSKDLIAIQIGCAKWELPQVTVEKARKVFNRPGSLGVLVLNSDTLCIFARPDVFLVLGGLKTDLSIHDSIYEFVERTTQHRRFSILEIGPKLRIQSQQSATKQTQSETLLIESHINWDEARVIEEISRIHALLSNDQNDEALNKIQRLIGIRPELNELLYAQAIASIKLGEFYKAQEILGALLSREPQHTNARLMLEKITIK